MREMLSLYHRNPSSLAAVELSDLLVLLCDVLYIYVYMLFYVFSTYPVSYIYSYETLWFGFPYFRCWFSLFSLLVLVIVLLKFICES